MSSSNQGRRNIIKRGTIFLTLSWTVGGGIHHQRLLKTMNQWQPTKCLSAKSWRWGKTKLPAPGTSVSKTVIQKLSLPVCLLHDEKRWISSSNDLLQNLEINWRSNGCGEEMVNSHVGNDRAVTGECDYFNKLKPPAVVSRGIPSDACWNGCCQ